MPGVAPDCTFAGTGACALLGSNTQNCAAALHNRPPQEIELVEEQADRGEDEEADAATTKAGKARGKSAQQVRASGWASTHQ